MTQTMERTCRAQDGTYRPGMLTVRDVARMLNCSVRTIYRLTDSGRMPRPVKLGALVRWPRRAVESWINEDCPRTEELEVSV